MHPFASNSSPLLVTAAILIENGQILITRRPPHKPLGGYWEFPGGKLHAGEAPQEALSRELREELAIEADVGRIFDVLFHRYDWGDVLLLAFLCSRVSGEIQNLEVAAHRWVPPQQLCDYELLPADRPLVEKLVELRLDG